MADTKLPAGVPGLMPQDIAPLILKGGTHVEVALHAYEIGAQRAAEARQAEVEALRADAVRYRWLREGQVITYRVSGRDVSNPFPACGGQHLDAAVDAALAAQRQEDSHE